MSITTEHEQELEGGAAVGRRRSRRQRPRWLRCDPAQRIAERPRAFLGLLGGQGGGHALHRRERNADTDQGILANLASDNQVLKHVHTNDIIVVLCF